MCFSSGLKIQLSPLVMKNYCSEKQILKKNEEFLLFSVNKVYWFSENSC